MQVSERDLELQVEQGSGEQRRKRLGRVGVCHPANAIVGQGEVRVDELDAGVHADRGKDAPGDGIEEGLAQLDVDAAGDKAGESGPHLSPHALGPYMLAQQIARVVHGAIHDTLVEVEASNRVALVAVPVAPLEAPLCALRDALEGALVEGEGIEDFGCSRVSERDCLGHGSPLRRRTEYIAPEVILGTVACGVNGQKDEGARLTHQANFVRPSTNGRMGHE